MDYAELLSRKEWQDKREEILIRDQHLCQVCHNENHFDQYSKGMYRKFSQINYGIIISNFKNYQKKTYPINSETLYKMPENGILYFEINENGWVNVVGYRDLIREEIVKYIDEPFEAMVDEYKELLKKYGDIEAPEIKNHICKTSPIIELNIAPEKLVWNKVFGLHVHHTYYIKGKLPWEYENESLVTLCWKCHEEKHQNGKIAVYDSLLNALGEYHYCKRCSGAGRFPEFIHVKEGVCFRCHGARYEELIGK